MLETLWDLMGTKYYQFIVVKEPELIEQWREYHKVTENTKLDGVFPSSVDKGSAFHVLKSHIPYKKKGMSTIYFGMHNGINRTGPHQYYPLEDYDTLIEVRDDPVTIPMLNENGEQVVDADKQPQFEEFQPIRHVAVSSEWLKDFNDSRADHKVQAEPPGKWDFLKDIVPYIAIVAVIYLIVTNVLPTVIH